MKLYVRENEDVEEVQVEILCKRRDEEVTGLIERIQNKEPKLLGYKDTQMYLIEIGKIFYIETVDNKLFVYLESEVIEVKYKLYEMEELLREKCFMRCNKSTIINIAKIAVLKPMRDRSLLAEMENGEEVYISRNYARKLKTVLEG